MEAQRRSKRKPLSDCTNTLPNHRKKPQSTTSSSKNPNSTETLIKPPKPSITAIGSKVAVVPPPPTTISSQKSCTSTGSNNFSNSVTAPRSPDPPAPPTPLSDADRKTSGLSVDQNQRDDETRRKEKGKVVVDTPISNRHKSGLLLDQSQRDDEMRRKEKGKVVVDTPIKDRTKFGLLIYQSHQDDETRRKEKGKMVVDTSVIDLKKSGLSVDQSKQDDETRSKEKGKMVVDTPVIDLKKSGLSVDQSKQDDETRRKVKGKMVVDTPVIDLKKSGLSVDQSKQDDETRRKEKGKMVVDAFIIDHNNSGHSVNQGQPNGETRRKDKGKMVVDTPFIPFSAYMSSKPLHIGSSAAPGLFSRSGVQAVHSLNLQAQTTKDKGKTAVNVSVVESPAPFTSKHLELSSSGISGSLSEASVAHSQELNKERRKDKGKIVSDPPNIEESEPSTPYAAPASPATSGTRNRPLMIYGQRKARQGRKNAVDKMNLYPSSEQKIRKTGFELDDDRGQKKGSYTDPLPMHKRDKHGGSVHVMPQEEVDKLRAYYANLDAFELPEEAVSESDLE